LCVSVCARALNVRGAPSRCVGRIEELKLISSQSESIRVNPSQSESVPGASLHQSTLAINIHRLAQRSREFEGNITCLLSRPCPHVYALESVRVIPSRSESFRASPSPPGLQWDPAMLVVELIERAYSERLFKELIRAAYSEGLFR
jgi:hypothetical protein